MPRSIHPTRAFAALVAGATVIPLLAVTAVSGVAGAADALPPVADPMGAGGVCEHAPTTEPFDDVEADDFAHDEIACLFHADITKGRTANTYVPAGTLTRRQMALFLTRTAAVADELDTGDAIAALPAWDGVARYPDTTAESAEVRTAIGRLSQAGVALGFGDGTYRPGEEISRRQMAKFIVRLLEHLAGSDLDPPSGDYFDDDEGDSGEVQLDQLAELGIFQGDGQGNVNPGEDLSRRQMALILLRMLQVLHADGHIDPLFPPDTGPVPLAPANASATASGTTVTLTYAESATPTADQYRIYRIVRPTGATTCPDFNAAGASGRGAYPATATATQSDPTPTTDGNTNRTFVDTGLAATTQYCYAVTTVDGGVESPAAQATVATTTNGPTIQDVRASDGGTTTLLVDAGDVHQFIFSEPMAATTDDPGQRYRASDGDGTVAEIICGTNANCVLQGAGTFNGVVYPANRVMRVYVTGAPTTITAGTAGLAYPGTITNVSSGWDDPGGDPLDLVNSVDRSIDVGTITPTPTAIESVRPDMTGAVADISADTVTLSYAEPVDCDSEAAGIGAQFVYSDSTTGADSPSGVQCNGTSSVVLTFSDGVIADGDDSGAITYTDNSASVDINDIRDVWGNQAMSPEMIGVPIQP